LANEDFPAKYIGLRPNDRKKGNPSPIVPSPKTWYFNEGVAIKKHFKKLISQIENILDNELEQFDDIIKNKQEYPFPILVELQDNKIAKNHRPSSILNQINSDVIAVQSLGELIISASRSSLEAFIELINDALEEVPNNRSDWLFLKDERETVTKSKERWYEVIHQLTCIKRLKLYNNDLVIEQLDETEMNSIRKDEEFKVRFFNYGDDETNQIVLSTFLKQLKDYGINRNKIRKLNFTNSLEVYAIPYLTDDIIKIASHFPGVESVSSFVYFESGSQEALVEEALVGMIQPVIGQVYPRVAIVDSGIGSNNLYLKDWIEDVDNYVIESNQDNYHGNFVAGIINYGHILNENIYNVVDTGVMLLDVTVLPDPKKERVREDDLLASLEQALEDYSDTYKVWNLSLSSRRQCTGFVSEFTASIDELQKRFGVLFVIAAGNASNNALKRIALPADSIRSVTVGSIALNSTRHDQVEKNMVVPYSRKGPGVGLSIKPEVVHFSGNPINSPIYSVDSNGKKIGDFGTSFSTPLVSAILGEYFSLYPQSMTPLMAKTILIHGAENPLGKNRIKDISTHYDYGYGLPRRITDILYGDEHEITLLFEGEIDSSRGTNWVKIDEFPFPESFYDEGSQKIKGNILVTMGYDTPLDPRYGSEYCRCNLDIRIRTRVNDSFKKITDGSKTDDASFEAKWERDRITSESKWSNIKQVEFKSPNGRQGTNELILEVLPTWRNLDEKERIPFVIALTIRDPKRELPVYKEITQKLNASFATTDIQLKNAPIRINI
jgi:serine protease AprX